LVEIGSTLGLWKNEVEKEKYLEEMIERDPMGIRVEVD